MSLPFKCSNCNTGIRQINGLCNRCKEEELTVENKGQSNDISNIESIVLKMLDRWNKSDEISQRHREEMVRELNDLSDVMMEVKGSVSRINGKR